MKVKPVKAAQILLPLAWTQALQQFLRMRHIAFVNGLRDQLDPGSVKIDTILLGQGLRLLALPLSFVRVLFRPLRLPFSADGRLLRLPAQETLLTFGPHGLECAEQTADRQREDHCSRRCKAKLVPTDSFLKFIQPAWRAGEHRLVL